MVQGCTPWPLVNSAHVADAEGPLTFFQRGTRLPHYITKIHEEGSEFDLIV